MSINIFNGGYLGALVKKKRSELGLSMAAIVEASGGEISNAYVSLIESGKVKPAALTLKKLIVLANVLGLSAQEVVNAALSDALGEESGGIIARVPQTRVNINDREREASEDRVQERAGGRATGSRKKR